MLRPEPASADIVVLAGDVHHGTKGLEWARAYFPESPVIYVAGNHEYYGEALPKLTDELRARAEALDVFFLDNTAVEVHGVQFLGCTLWTDLQLFGPHPWVADAVLDAMVDYRSIRVSPRYRRLRPGDTIRAHKTSVRWLRDFIAQPHAKMVVVTHHAPSARSLSSERANDPVSAAYASHLDDLVTELAPSLWIHGHTHYSMDYVIGSTRVVSNQRGYVDEPSTGFVPDLIVEV